MTDDYYKDFVLALESAENSYMRELRRVNPSDERGMLRRTYSSFKDYVNKLIAELTKFIAKSKEALTINIRKILVKSDMAKILKKADDQFGKNAQGITITCPDFPKYAIKVRDASDKVWKEAEKIINKNYVDVNQMDKDLARFEVVYNNGWEEITAATKLRTMTTIEEFRSICKNEIKGDSIISRTVSDSIHKMKKAEIEIDYISKRRTSMEENRIVPHKLNVLQRIIARMAKFCSRIWKGFVEMVAFMTT